MQSTFKVGQIAKELEVTPNTIRAWSKLYAPWLSPAATPTDAQTARKYNLRDIAVLRAVAAMRNEGKIHQEIVDALNGMAFPDEVEPNAQENGSQRVATSPQQPPQTAQDAPQLPAMVVDMLRDEIRAVRLQTDQAQRQQRDRVTMLLYGVLIGAVGVMLLFWLAYGLLALSQR